VKLALKIEIAVEPDLKREMGVTTACMQEVGHYHQTKYRKHPIERVICIVFKISTVKFDVA
jgi:hypothetical protein